LHILTKIFIVLTSLLSVAIVPLVMLNAANEETFKKKWIDEQARSKEAVFAKEAAQRLQETEVRAAMDSATDLRVRLERVTLERDTALSEAVKAAAQMAGTQEQFNRLTANLQVLTESNKVSGDLAAAVITEMNSLRTQLTSALEENNNLDREKAVLQNANEVLTASNRRLKEDLDKAGKEKAEAQAKVSQFVAQVGDLPGARPGAIRDVTAKVPADRALSATILGVRRGASGTLAEINAGSRDGVQPGWTMTIADGGKFVGNLRITTVDVNRSVGVVELEDAANRGEVKAGLRVMSRKGE
jgi:regulator of replication initiation timing